MRVTIDLMKKSTQIIDLSNVINPRVGDDDLLLPLHIIYGDNQTDMRGKDVEFLSNDPNKKNIYIAGTCNTNTPGDNLYTGDLTFRFPAGTFQADGTYDPDKTMFRIVDKETQKVISSVNVKITVMKNNIEFDFDPDNSSYDSRLETMLHDFHDKGQTMLDEIKDLKNQANSNVSGDTATTAKEAKKQADQNAGDISDLKGEVAGARGRFANMAGREDAQDAAINQKESIANANANYISLKQKDAQQDAVLAQKAGKFELEDKLAQMSLEPEAFENETALKAKYPNGKSGLMVTADTGHKWLWIKGAWKDCGVYQAAGPDPELVDLRTDYRGDKYKTAGEAIKSDFSNFAKASVTNSADHRVMYNLPTSGFTNVAVNGDHLFTGVPLFDDSVPKKGSHFTGKYDGKSYWHSLTVPVKAYDVLQATFTGTGVISTISIYYLDKDNNVLRLDSFDSHEGTPIDGQNSRYKFTNHPIYCDYNVAEVIICSIDSAPTASIRVPGTSIDVPAKGHWINGSDWGNGSLNTANMGFRVTTDLPICYDTEVTIFASNNVVFFIDYYDDPSGNSKATETFGERTWARIPAGQYFRLTLCHSDGSQTPLDVADAVNSIHFRVPSRFDLANQREMLAQAELADRQENIYALVAQDAYDAGKHYHMEKIVDQDKEAKENLDSFQSVYLGKDALHMFGYHNGKPVDRTWNSAGELIAETEKPDTGHDGDVTKIGDDFYIVSSTITDNTVANNVIYKWDSKTNTKEVIDISSRIGTATDASHVRSVAGIDRVEGSDSQLIIVTTDGLPDLGKGSIRSASDKLIFWKYDIPSDTLSEINEMRWTETFVQGVTCLDGITYIATNPITRHASDYAGIKIIGYDSGTFRKIKEIYIKGVFEAEGLSHVVENGVPKLVFGLCHYQDLMRVYSLTL